MEASGYKSQLTVLFDSDNIVFNICSVFNKLMVDKVDG